MTGPVEIIRIVEPTGPLTLESMRADIAAMLHELPEAIGNDDDLIDLGLDSMRVMSLVLKWSEGGLDLEFGELAERQTLAGWWEIVSAKLGASG